MNGVRGKGTKVPIGHDRGVRSVFQLYTAGTGFFHVMVQRPIHVGFALILTFLTYPFFRRICRCREKSLVRRVDLFLAFLAFSLILYLRRSAWNH